MSELEEELKNFKNKGIPIYVYYLCCGLVMFAFMLDYAVEVPFFPTFGLMIFITILAIDSSYRTAKYKQFLIWLIHYKDNFDFKTFFELSLMSNWERKRYFKKKKIDVIEIKKEHVL